jgi:hypothetical protein
MRGGVAERKKSEVSDSLCEGESAPPAAASLSPLERRSARSALSPSPAQRGTRREDERGQRARGSGAERRLQGSSIAGKRSFVERSAASLLRARIYDSRTPRSVRSKIPRGELESSRLSAGHRPGEREQSEDWRIARVCLKEGGVGEPSRPALLSLSFIPPSFPPAIWLILPVAICLSQRLSHACASTSRVKVRPRMAH